MPSEHWSRVERIFREAAEQPAGLREEFIARVCGPDLGVREEVASLLTADAESKDFLATPALDAFAREISREGWSLQAGGRIGSYILERRLGIGGMGEVWRARDARLARDVAIKVLLPTNDNAAERM